jgi:hypothetical protein
MIALDFEMEPSFECGDGDAGDVDFVKATHSISSRDVAKEYMAYGHFPMSMTFRFGEVKHGETSVLGAKFQARAIRFQARFQAVSCIDAYDGDDVDAGLSSNGLGAIVNCGYG